MSVLDVCKTGSMPYFYPVTRVISAITNSYPCTITTMVPHGYQSLLIIRVDIPTADGMQQLNQQTAMITVTSPTTITIPIDTTLYDPFTIPVDPLNPGLPPPGVQICAFVVPIGEANETVYQATVNTLR